MNYISKIKKEEPRIKNLSLSKKYNLITTKAMKNFHFTTTIVTICMSSAVIFENMPAEYLIIPSTITIFSGYNIVLLKDKSELLDVILENENKSIKK